MIKKTGIFLSLFLSLTLLMAGIHDAEAKRMGGGKSFGSKPSYSMPYQRSASPMSSNQPTRSAAQQQAAAQNQAARQNWANRGGLMGLLGGLALGGLLGSLFFGGAFEGINFIDILLFAGIAFLAFRLLAAKSSRQPQPAAGTYDRDNDAHYESTYYRDNQTSSNPGFDTDILFGKGGLSAPTSNTALNIPADFDQTGFIAGAEAAFRHLQAAWDQRDLATIRSLTTDKVFAELQEQLRSSNSENKTEVLKVSAELLEVREVGNELEATVLYDSIMREDGGETSQVREVWHFIKPVNSKQTKWFLDGIQQLEN